MSVKDTLSVDKSLEVNTLLKMDNNYIDLGKPKSRAP